MARPKLDINSKEVEKLSSYGLNNTEIADFFNCSESVIRQRFNESITKGRAELKRKLRKAQLDFALKGNPTLLIWLGKQYLGQREPKDEIDIRISDLPTNIDELSDEEVEKLYKEYTNGSKAKDS